MNIEEIIENTIRKVVREELDRHKNDIATTPTSKNDNSKYGDVGWLCKFLGVEKQTVYGYNSARKYPFIKKGKKVVYNKEEIKKIIESNRVHSAYEMKKQALQNLTQQRTQKDG